MIPDESFVMSSSSIRDHGEEYDMSTGTIQTGASTSSSRLRRLDKLVLDQSSLLDEDDQMDYITQLSNYNLNQYHTYRKWIFYFYILQIVIIVLLNFISTDVHNKLLLLLIFLSVSLHVVSIQELPRKYHYNVTILGKKVDVVSFISVINVVISAEVGYLDFFKIKVYYFGVLMICNILLPRMHRSMFDQIDKSVKELDKLKYKYKNV
ncbi:hypothetical protein KGF57_002069 [Candida theae]|uniref:Uncharacterized protein n=1 Tax=Candida theae TaxID=1198502 RepID=A0AAD5BGG1_9ASCO|nr:uncharacterized protein KGF57_002069 [Candida theae]KAI5959544.1 hypothetical protein KGF57_002069 [Candida theae]